MRPLALESESAEMLASVPFVAMVPRSLSSVPVTATRVAPAPVWTISPERLDRLPASIVTCRAEAMPAS